MSAKCMYCPKDNDLRPYGPGGGLICFQCMKSSPWLEKTAQRAFSKQLNDCDGDALIDTRNNEGPVPITITMGVVKKRKKVGVK